MTSLSDLSPRTEVLPPTAAGKARAVNWYVGLLAEGWQTDHLFTFAQQGRPVEGYAVKELPARGHRRFQVRKAGSGGAYTVACGPKGADCDCPAGEIRHVDRCRHVLAVEAALANGWL